jgi:lysozyme
MNAPEVNEAVALAAELCRHFEGFRSRPYICPAGYPTIGYGTVYKPDGTRVTMDDPPISKAQADEWLLSELRSNYGAGILKASPNLIKHPRVLAAAIDFAYNLGVSRYRASTLRKRLEAEDWNEARVQLMRWTKAGGRELPGLVRRRKAEASLLP